MKMNNNWNRFIYGLWAPVYDGTVDLIFKPGRRAAFRLLDLKQGDHVLLVGVGTGADLPFIPGGVNVTGVDLSPAMLARARSKLPIPGCSVEFIQGDAQTLLVQEAAFDAVVFNLILSVIPEGRLCLQQNLRALRPGGQAVIFDKFAPESGKVSLIRRVLNIFSTLFGTEITRRFSEMLEGSGAKVIKSEPSIMNGNYQIYLLKKTNNS